MIPYLKKPDNFNNVVHFKSVKYRRVCRATGQAELAALSLGVDECLNIQFTLKGLGFPKIQSIFYTDAQVVMDQLRNPHKAEIHSRLQALFLEQCLKEMEAVVEKVSTEEQKADILTKVF